MKNFPNHFHSRKYSFPDAYFEHTPYVHHTYITYSQGDGFLIDIFDFERQDSAPVAGEVLTHTRDEQNLHTHAATSVN